HRDQEASRAIDSVMHGLQPSWTHFDRDESDRFNAAGVAALRDRDWEDARRLLLSRRADLVIVLEELPESPAEIWSPQHPLGAMLLDLAWNDRHHADIIKRWRLNRGQPGGSL